MRANSLDLIDSGSTTWGASRTTGGGTGSAKARTPNAPRDNSFTSPRDNPKTTPRLNPYAAPQTIDRPVALSALPMAQLAESAGTRQLFPEQSTAALAGMARRSKALQEVQFVWFVIGSLIAVSGFIFCYKTNDLMYSVPAAAGSTAALIRWYAGTARNRSDRYLACGMDFLLLATTIGLGVWLFYSCSQGLTYKGGTRLKPTMIEVWALILAMPFLFYPGYYSLRSLRALFGGQLLFGPERLKHEDLVTELRYRQELGIE